MSTETDILRIVERLARVETLVTEIKGDVNDLKNRKDLQELKQSYKAFRKDFYEWERKVEQKLDAIHACNNNNNGINRRDRVAIYVALISSVALVISKFIEIFPLLLG